MLKLIYIAHPLIIFSLSFRHDTIIHLLNVHVVFTIEFSFHSCFLIQLHHFKIQQLFLIFREWIKNFLILIKTMLKNHILLFLNKLIKIFNDHHIWRVKIILLLVSICWKLYIIELMFNEKFKYLFSLF